MLSTAFEQTIATNGSGPTTGDNLPYLVPNSDAAGEPLKALHAVRMSDVIAQEVQWLWEPLLPLGTFCLAEGPEGIGKTFIACALACSIGHGRGLPGIPTHSHVAASNVVLISAEDSLAFVLKPRLASMGAPMERILAIDEPFTFDDDGILRLSMVLAEHEPKLVVIDPLFSYTGRINLNNDNEIRSITDQLKRLAETYNCTILGIRHIGKSKGFGDVRNAGLNGVGWRASARSCLLIGQNPENEREKAICQTKSNYGPKYEGSIGFEIIDGQFRWSGASSLTAEMMLSFTRSESTEERGERHDAMGFLRETLGQGRMLSKEVQTAAKGIGVSEATLRRAKTAMGVKSIKDASANGAWFWELPGVEGDHEDAHILSSDHLQLNNSLKTSYRNDLTEGAHPSISEHVREHLHGDVHSGSASVAISGTSIGGEYGHCPCGQTVYIGLTCHGCGLLVEAK